MHLPERLDAAFARRFPGSLGALLDQGVAQICLDFSQVEVIDSAGLGQLLLAHKKTRELDRSLTTANVANEYVKQLLELVGWQEASTADGLAADGDGG